MTLVSGSLFSGYGGLDLAVEDVLRTRTVWTCDVDQAASRILRHRFPHAPNLGDIGDIDWSTVRPVHVLTGGFPCQDVSPAGARLLGNGVVPQQAAAALRVLLAWRAVAVTDLRLVTW